MSKELDKQIKIINEHHALLVFPIKNKPEPLSLWKAMYPRTEMRWEWTDEADDKVVKLWHSREQLAKSGLVVYSKWYQNRATLFSKELFVNMMAFLETVKYCDGIMEKTAGADREARLIMDSLMSDSPQSTKQVKEVADLQGKFLEGKFNKVMKQLWFNLAIVAYGEVDDSSFPSLAIGSTQVLFEDLWLESAKINKSTAFKNIVGMLGPQNLFVKQLAKAGMPTLTRNRK